MGVSGGKKESVEVSGGLEVSGDQWGGGTVEVSGGQWTSVGVRGVSGGQSRSAEVSGGQWRSVGVMEVSGSQWWAWAGSPLQRDWSQQRALLVLGIRVLLQLLFIRITVLLQANCHLTHITDDTPVSVSVSPTSCDSYNVTQRASVTVSVSVRIYRPYLIQRSETTRRCHSVCVTIGVSMLVSKWV